MGKEPKILRLVQDIDVIDAAFIGFENTKFAPFARIGILILRKSIVGEFFTFRAISWFYSVSHLDRCS